MVKGFISRDNVITVILGFLLTISFCLAMYIPIASFRQDSTQDSLPLYHEETYTFSSDSTINAY